MEDLKDLEFVKYNNLDLNSYDKNFLDNNSSYKIDVENKCISEYKGFSDKKKWENLSDFKISKSSKYLLFTLKQRDIKDLKVIVSNVEGVIFNSSIPNSTTYKKSDIDNK